MTDHKWINSALSDIAVNIKDGTHGSYKRVSNGVPFLSAKNVTDQGVLKWDESDDRVSVEDYESICMSYTPERNDLLLTIVGTLGRRTLFDGARVAFQRSVAFIRPSRKKVVPRYLYHAIASPHFLRQLVCRSNATAQAGLYLGELEKTTVPLPPLADQLHIAFVLDIVQEAIMKTAIVISKLKQVRTGMLHDLLTRGLDEHGQLRDPITRSDFFRESTIGRIPHAWDVVTIESIGATKRYAIVDGPFGSNLKTIHYRDKGIPVIQSGYVTSGEFLADDYFYIDQDLFEEQRRSAVEPGDIIMAKIGARCGTCAILPAGHQIGILAGNSLKISTNNDKCRSQFLLRLLHYYYALGIIDRIKSETAQPAISLKNLRAMLMPLPSPQEQDSIISCLDSNDATLKSEQANLAKLEQLRSGLMTDLLTGRVRVPETLTTEVGL